MLTCLVGSLLTATHDRRPGVHSQTRYVSIYFERYSTVPLGIKYLIPLRISFGKVGGMGEGLSYGDVETGAM